VKFTTKGIELNKISIIVPSYEEGELLSLTLTSIIADCAEIPYEILVIVDTIFDSSIEIVRKVKKQNKNINVLIQENNGAYNAIRFGIRQSNSPFLVIFTADNTDDSKDILKMYRCLMDGAEYVVASRYLSGGSYSGGSKFKRTLSICASKILELRHGAIGSDPTNGFKALSRNFYEQVELVESKGFTYGLQFLYNAIRLNLEVRVIPTTWKERVSGTSKFKIMSWLPSYLYWFLKLLVISSPKSTRKSRVV